jgi:hypothetical protein
MPANTSPIFTVSSDLTWGSTNPITTVNTGTGATAYDGTTNAVLLFTGGVNGSFLQKIVCEAGGANNVSVLRIHLNNGSTNATASNNSLYMQYSLPATTASNTTATAHLEIPLMLQIPPNYRIYVSLGAAANLASGWYFNIVAGEY